MYHHIPFYVAAPLTSIDLSLSSGQEIIIEERSAKELLHTRGGLGEQVAASGISVWNPAFDVTPANLIAGIITEKVSLSLFWCVCIEIHITPVHMNLFVFVPYPTSFSRCESHQPKVKTEEKDLSILLVVLSNKWFIIREDTKNYFILYVIFNFPMDLHLSLMRKFWCTRKKEIKNDKIRSCTTFWWLLFIWAGCHYKEYWCFWH